MLPITDTKTKIIIRTSTGLAIIGLLSLFASYTFLLQFKSLLRLPESSPLLPPTIESLNQQVMQLSELYIRTQPSNRQPILVKLTSVVQQRKQRMLALVSKNPQAFIDLSLSGRNRSRLAETLQPNVEEHAVLEGNVEILHKDDFNHSFSTTDYLLHADGQETSTLYFTTPPTISRDTRVTIRGLKIDSSIAVEDQSSTATSAPTPIVSAAVDKKVAVILFNFQDDPNNTPITTDTMRGVVFTDKASTNTYYQEISFDQINLIGKVRKDGDVYGWYTIPYPTAGCDANWSRWVTAASAAATAAGVDLTGYDNVIYASPRLPANLCRWSGLATIGAHVFWINGYFDWYFFGHELGHNFGANHAATHICKNPQNQRVAISTSCTYDEYGDGYDIMGTSTHHMNTFHKGQVGFYSSPGDTTDVTSDRTYSLVPVESSSGVRAIRIPRKYISDRVLDYYYLEYRQPSGQFDNFMPTESVVNGVSLRIAPNYGVASFSYLIDTSPNSSSDINTDFYDSALKTNQSFDDPYTGIHVRTDEVSGSSATVNISFTCVRINPSVKITPKSQWGKPGQSLSYILTLTNNDSVGCGSSNFTLTGTLPNASWIQSPNTTTISLAPHASTSQLITVTSPSNAVDGDYPFTETLASTTNSSNTGRYKIDITKPDISIVSPTDGFALPQSGNVTISSSASDINAITNMQISIDGQTIQTCGNFLTQCSYTWSMIGVKSGPHEISASAVDEAGNTSSSSIHVCYPYQVIQGSTKQMLCE